MWPIPESCFPLVFLSPSLSGQMPDAVTLRVFRDVFPACLPVSPSLCGQMPDAVTLAPGSCLRRSAPFASLRLMWQQLASAIEKHQARNIDSTSQQEPLATMFPNIRLIALLRKPVPHFLVKCKFASLCGASAEPCRALNVSILFSINNYFAQYFELLFGSAVVRRRISRNTVASA